MNSENTKTKNPYINYALWFWMNHFPLSLFIYLLVLVLVLSKFQTSPPLTVSKIATSPIGITRTVQHPIRSTFAVVEVCTSSNSNSPLFDYYFKLSVEFHLVH